MKRLSVQGATIQSAAFNPEGNLLATGGYDRSVTIWDADSGTALRSLSHDGDVGSIAFSHDGKLVATASSQTARIWRVADGKLLYSITHGGGVNAVQFSSDDRYIATACDDKQIRIFPVDDGVLEKLAEERLAAYKPNQELCSKYLGKASTTP